MADNFQVTEGSGTTIATDQGGSGEHYQKIKLIDPTPDSTTGIGTSGNPLRTDPVGTTAQPVSGTIAVSNFPATQNVAVTSTVETEVKNDSGNPIPVNGTVSVGNFPSTQLIREVDATGRDLALQSKQSYSMTTAGFTPAATATDFFKITGSATKTVRIIDLRFGGTATAATLVDVFTIKRSTDDTAGTFVAATPVPHDSNNAAATVTVGHYTANPTLGTAVGTVLRKKVLLPISTTTSNDVNISLVPPGGQTLLDQPITLRGTSQVLTLNFNGAAIPTGGANWYVVCEWLEE